MGLKKVGRLYWLDIRINKKRIRRSLKVTNYFEALDQFKKLKDSLLQERSGGKIKLSDFSEKYLKWAWSSKPASAQREEQRLNRIIEFFSGLGIIFLDDITPYHIELLKTKLREEKKSSATINRYLQILRGLFYRAIDWELYDKPNPLKKIKFLREEKKSRALSRDEFTAVLSAAQNLASRPKSPIQTVFADLVILAANTGLRKSELLNLRWRDLTGEEIAIKGKGGRTRIIPLNRQALAVILKYPRRYDFIFDIPNRHQKDLFRRTIEQIRKKSGIRFHFHQLRHFFATSLLGRGVDIVTISEILGHSKIMTSLIYSHTSSERKARAVALLDIMGDT